MFDFPASPTEDQTFTPPGGPTYTWKSPRWIATGFSSTSIPEAPNDGKSYARQSLAWNDLTDEFAAKAPVSHTHTTAQITNLDTALAGKEPTIALGTTAQYWRGDKSWQTLPITASEPPIATGTTSQWWRGDKTWQALPAQDWSVITNKPTTFPPSSHSHPQSEVTSLVADLALKAPLASPSLTGTPLAPTASAGTSTTQIATTAFVTTADALKAPLASPAFTGTPTAPTPTAGDNDTSLATTAFVSTAIAAIPSWAAGNIVRTVALTSGTWNKPVGLKYMDVIVIGAGGGSGYAGATPAGQSAAGGGGGGGGYCAKLWPAASLPASLAYTIGAGGGMTATGGNSQYGAMIGNGGVGGIFMAAGTTPTSTAQGTGGAASGGDINTGGGHGGVGVRCAHGSAVIAVGGTGGGSVLAPADGGMPLTNASYVGPAGRFPGGGSGGAAAGASIGAGANGGTGANGCIIFTEYY